MEALRGERLLRDCGKVVESGEANFLVCIGSFDGEDLVKLEGQVLAAER